MKEINEGLDPFDGSFFQFLPPYPANAFEVDVQLALAVQFPLPSWPLSPGIPHGLGCFLGFFFWPSILSDQGRRGLFPPF